MSLIASGPKLNIPVVTASGAVVAAPAVPIVSTPAVAPVVLATGPKSMLNTAKGWLGLGGRRRGRKAATRRRGRKGASRRQRRGRKGASRRR